MAFLPRRRSEGGGAIAGLQSEMNRLFENFFGRSELPALFGGNVFAPAVDVVETKDAILVKAELPGIDSKDLDISITGDLLTIRGEKKSEREEKGKNFHRMERSYGSFTRTVEIPSYANTDKVLADYKDGVLTVSLAKKEEAKEKTVKVDIK